VSLGLRHVGHHAEDRHGDVAQEALVSDRRLVGPGAALGRFLAVLFEGGAQAPADVGCLHGGTIVYTGARMAETDIIVYSGGH